MHNDKSNLAILIAALLILLLMPYTFPRSNMSNNTADVEPTPGIVDEMYSKVSDDSLYYKAELLSYTDEGFKMAVVKDEDRNYGTLKLFTKTNGGTYRELDVNTNNITINILTEDKAPYAEIKFTSNNSTKNVADVILYLPSTYSIDTYSDNDSIQYKITEYPSGGYSVISYKGDLIYENSCSRGL